MNSKKFPHMSALVSADFMPNPMEILAATHADAPPKGKQFLESRIMEILMVDLPCLKHVVQEGVVMDSKNLMSLQVAFESSMKIADEIVPEIGKTMTATIRDIADRIAAEVDKGFKRILLEDKYASRFAMLNAAVAHAKLVRCISEIALTDDEKKAHEDANAS